LRQARGGIEPDPVMAVTPVILGGADGITIHLREDRRHIQDRDLKLLREIVPVELNLEMAAIEEMIAIASQIKPDMVTLVPEKRHELTTEGGLDVKSNMEALRLAVDKLQDKGIPGG
ncbi:MAG TPA: pyridoxine 5'-phosphate synthase, partial [Nitrospiraceae bacterium]|nr:pyridoxine 5'-phosphate synthase [Nitrospiraceae bacterium]